MTVAESSARTSINTITSRSADVFESAMAETEQGRLRELLRGKRSRSESGTCL
jgi:hypothetical protein